MIAKTNFSSKGIKLPGNWSQPGNQYPDAFKASEKTVPPNPPTNLFKEASLNKYHVDSAKEIGKQLEKYIDGICGAVCDGIDKWLKAATIAGVIIMGPTGIVKPGSVIGPALTGLIMASAPQGKPQEAKYSKAIASAFGTAWQLWHMGLLGTLMYPPFAAFPAPVAPPMPNVPVPLITFSSGGEAMLAPGSLLGFMVGNLGDPQALHATDLFDAIAGAFNPVFLIFKSTTLVKNVLGTGPVPTFAPPFVPVGPVMGGTGNGAPGCLS